MRPRLGFFVAGILLLIFCAGLAGGCRKSKDATPPPLPSISLGGNDLTPDGRLSDKGLKQVQDQSGQKALAISFFRCNLSDAGLAQLAQFKNIRRIEAVGSSVTADGIQKFKQEIPEAEVVK